jgi:hypothetical protein
MPTFYAWASVIADRRVVAPADVRMPGGFIFSRR